MVKDYKNLKKISIIGCSGSGKSTLAHKLGTYLNLPVIHLDCLYWQPNWVAVEKEDFQTKVNEITRSDAWIIEGNYNITFDERFEQSDLVIVLDFDLDFCLESIKIRSAKGKDGRIGLPMYLDETENAQEELVQWVLGYPARKSEFADPLIEKYQQKVLILTNREEVNHFLEQLNHQY
jgi:adenylate kinase family enzyme